MDVSGTGRGNLGPAAPPPGVGYRVRRGVGLGAATGHVSLIYSPELAAPNYTLRNDIGTAPHILQPVTNRLN